MALQADVQYVSYRVDGTAARKVERHTAQGNVTPAYKRRRAEHKVIAVDPLALAGIAVSAVMLIAMIFGVVQYRNALQDSRQMSQYVQQLQQQNEQLEQSYKEGYDLDEIRDIAEEIGMVSSNQMEEVMISVQKPQQEEVRLSFWESISTFLTGIFA